MIAFARSASARSATAALPRASQRRAMSSSENKLTDYFAFKKRWNASTAAKHDHPIQQVKVPLVDKTLPTIFPLKNEAGLAAGRAKLANYYALKHEWSAHAAAVVAPK